MSLTPSLTPCSKEKTCWVKRLKDHLFKTFHNLRCQCDRPQSFQLTSIGILGDRDNTRCLPHDHTYFGHRVCPTRCTDKMYGSTLLTLKCLNLWGTSTPGVTQDYLWQGRIDIFNGLLESHAHQTWHKKKWDCLIWFMKLWAVISFPSIRPHRPPWYRYWITDPSTFCLYFYLSMPDYISQLFLRRGCVLSIDSYFHLTNPKACCVEHI